MIKKQTGAVTPHPSSTLSSNQKSVEPKIQTEKAITSKEELGK